MSSPKERRKARRRAERTMDEAWEALLANDLTMAERLARRAIAGGEMNARLWLDLGRILRRCNRPDDAEEALRRAIALAPTHGEAFAELAAFQAGAGKWVQAERLQRRAVELLPQDASAHDQLACYAAMLPADAADAAEEPPPPSTDRTERYDWDAVAVELRARGCALLPRLVAAGECDALRALWDADCFEHRFVEDGEDEGRVEHRFFQLPLPPLVQELRAEVYARLRPIANEWQRLLERRPRFPPAHAAFLARCAAAGQHRTSPALLRYPPGGFGAPRRDDAGRVTFPFQLAVALGPEPFAQEGGALRLIDVRPGRLRERRLACGPGDGALSCTQERLCEIAGVVAAQPVQHAVSECAAERWLLVVPFHDQG
jgi:hypothetical protein